MDFELALQKLSKLLRPHCFLESQRGKLIRLPTKLVSGMRLRTGTKSAIACDFNAFTLRQRKNHELLSKELLSGCRETRAVRNGYSFRFLGETSLYLKVARWITLEKLCCPFFTFNLSLAGQDGSVWLRITGPRGVKQLLKNYFRQRSDQLIKINLSPYQRSE